MTGEAHLTLAAEMAYQRVRWPNKNERTRRVDAERALQFWADWHVENPAAAEAWLRRYRNPPG